MLGLSSFLLADLLEENENQDPPLVFGSFSLVAPFIGDDEVSKGGADKISSGFPRGAVTGGGADVGSGGGTEGGGMGGLLVLPKDEL